MKQINTTVYQCREKLAWEHLYPKTNQLGRCLGKEGGNLPNNITEDVVGISLCPKYSKKHLRRISRIHKANYDGVPKGLHTIRNFPHNKSNAKYLTVKPRFPEEDIL
jgi:hypothetical protein